MTKILSASIERWLNLFVVVSLFRLTSRDPAVAGLALMSSALPCVIITAGGKAIKAWVMTERLAVGV